MIAPRFVLKVCAKRVESIPIRFRRCAGPSFTLLVLETKKAADNTPAAKPLSIYEIREHNQQAQCDKLRSPSGGGSKLAASKAC
jgi:hypothetical protein